jgi:type IV secretion system protein VirB8
MKSLSSQNNKMIDRSVNFEISLSQKTKESERRAWIVAIVSAALVVALIIAFAIILPLKEKIPYLVITDSITGNTVLTKITGDFGVDEITRNEAVNKSNVAKFLRARESYDYEIITRTDWNVVHSMAVPTVAAPYGEQYLESSTKNPDKLYGRDKVVRVEIKTLVLSNPPDNLKRYTGATVRFDKSVVGRRDNRIESKESFIATIAFEYSANLKMTEELRLENPLGFRVTSYRVDAELGSNKPVSLKDSAS